jgi:benzoyl-CoA reductase/2-hydroxyglutaryl-CoA dehydratase subunit BcrC/BadD/HgdB
MMYSLGLGDPQPTNASDSKIAFAIEGEAARDMFDSMAPDVRDVCTAGTNVRVRTKGHVTCQREKPGDYRCSFGFDLRTGKSIGGSVC